jgi:hypothetical protein
MPMRDCPMRKLLEGIGWIASVLISKEMKDTVECVNTEGRNSVRAKISDHRDNRKVWNEIEQSRIVDSISGLVRSSCSILNEHTTAL